jgi:hypothetical protein
MAGTSWKAFGHAFWPIPTPSATEYILGTSSLCNVQCGRGYMAFFFFPCGLRLLMCWWGGRLAAAQCASLVALEVDATARGVGEAGILRRLKR